MTDNSGYDELLDETQTFEFLRQKIDEWIMKFGNISNSIPDIETIYKIELEKVLQT